MKKNNKGFTLTELLVCVVIFSIILVAIFGFMLTSAKSYNTVNDRLDIQLQSQLASNQLSEYLIDCTTGIYTSPSGDCLYIVNNETYESKPYTVHIFKLSDGNIEYGKHGATRIDNDGKVSFSFTNSVSTLLTDRIDTSGGNSGFKVTLKPDDTDDPQKAITAVVELSLKKRSATYSVSKTVSLRNRPLILDTVP